MTRAPFGVKVAALRLVRHVEIYAWEETKREEKRKNDKGEEETVTTYSYTKRFQAVPADSSRFKESESHKNPEKAAFADQDFTAKDARLGAFVLPSEALGKLTKLEPVRVSQDMLARSPHATKLRELEGAEPGSAIRFRVHAEPGVRALAAPSYVRIVLETLIQNSLDVLRERGGAGEVDIDISRKGDRAVVRVSDDGPGIPEGAAESIFEPLRTTKVRGLGLGLAIARALSRAMKGDLSLERGDDRHTTFRLELGAP